MTHPQNKYALVADIGGTNTRVALADGTRVLPDTIRRYANMNFAGLEPVLQQYLSEEGDVSPIATCVAVAGPVQDGQATMTNLDWTMTNASLAAATNAPTVAILNDLQAQGYAVGHIADENLDTVLAGDAAKPTAAKLVVGVGTGFNAAPVIESAGGRVVPPSESGHVTLPTLTPADRDLADFVAQIHGFPSVEDVLSGRGIENVYRFVTTQKGTPAQMKAQAIMAACDAGDADALETVAICVRMLGAVCGNLALTLLPFGGIYLVGGVSRALAPHLEKCGFAAAFQDKGRFADFMQQFPISVVTDDYAALTGCAAYLAQID
ncbi:glucokinase [Loktanella ponticola]|uniref:Glucokinase n=1 Tax=Yoonia ponticola TaxID=1524255 RepID=A0A7W9BJX7_9RHOB|nr:ROK family protein [Yoonia ponticola]MBB5721622.1 glucokinase [Yoonia ponticola]